MRLLLPVLFTALVVLAAAVLLGHPAARHHTRRQGWRHWAHRTGILYSPSCMAPYGTRRHRAQLAAGLPFQRPSIRARARIVASHTRRGLRAECPAQCGEAHTERWPCAVAPRSSR